MSIDSPLQKRRDATRNRIQLLAAAREVFAELGPDAPLEEVASRASVSRTTLYRNFTTRQELAAEIYEDNVAKIEAFAAGARNSEHGIVDVFDCVLDMMIDDRSLFHIVADPEMTWHNELVSRFGAVFGPLIQSGKQAGIVREDVTMEDFRLAFGMAEAGTRNLDPSRRKNIKPRIRNILSRALFTDKV